MYAELRQIAHQRLRRESGNPSLNTTGLVHDAYLKLIDLRHAQFQDRGHFMAMASRVMLRTRKASGSASKASSHPVVRP